MNTPAWKWYVRMVNRSFPKIKEDTGITYWQNRLFLHIIIYFLPLSLLVVIPGVIMCFKSGFNELGLIEIATFFVIALITFSGKISLTVKKFFFVGVIHFIGFILLYYIGSLGPGRLYLLMATFFTVLVFPAHKAYWSTVLIILISGVLALGIHYKKIHTELGAHYNLFSWLAVSVNLVILSWLIVLLMPRLFYKLEQANERFRIISRATSDIIWEWNLADNHIDFSSGVKEMFGYNALPVMAWDKWWLEKIHPDDRGLVANFYGACAQNKNASTVRLQYRVQCGDGTYKHVFNRAAIVRDKAFKPERMIGAIQDISEITSYVNAIESQNQKLREIAWTQSHVVRAPLARLMGLVNILKNDNKKELDLNEMLEHLTDSANELDKIIHDISLKTEAAKIS